MERSLSHRLVEHGRKTKVECLISLIGYEPQHNNAICVLSPMLHATVAAVSLRQWTLVQLSVFPHSSEVAIPGFLVMHVSECYLFV